MFTESIRRSIILYCLLLDHVLVCLRRLLRLSHPLLSSERSLLDLLLGEGMLTCDHFLPFSNVMSDILWTQKSCPGSALLSEKCCVKMDPRNVQKHIRKAVSKVRFGQQMHFLYLFMWLLKNQHFLSWSCCYLGVLSKWHFYVFIRVHALWMCWNEQSLYHYLERNCPRA